MHGGGMIIWEIHDKEGGSIGFRPTKVEAEAVRKWQVDKGEFAAIRPIKFKPTRAGIADMMDDYAGGAGL